MSKSPLNISFPQPLSYGFDFPMHLPVLNRDKRRRQGRTNSVYRWSNSNKADRVRTNDFPQRPGRAAGSGPSSHPRTWLPVTHTLLPLTNCPCHRLQPSAGLAQPTIPCKAPWDWKCDIKVISSAKVWKLHQNQSKCSNIVQQCHLPNWRFVCHLQA
jgi:hypothetical protein